MDNSRQIENKDRLEETLGSHLKRTRRSQHKTLEDAAAATRIHITSLEALEKDDFASLPAEIFVRGFIKLYAKYLGLDPHETLDQYIAQECVDPERPADKPYRRDVLDGEAMAASPSLLKKSSRFFTIGFLVALLVLLYVLGSFFKASEKSTPKNQVNNEIARSLLEPSKLTFPEATQKVIEPSSPVKTRTSPAQSTKSPVIAASSDDVVDPSETVILPPEDSEKPATPKASAAAVERQSAEIQSSTPKNDAPETKSSEVFQQNIDTSRPVLPITVKVSTGEPDIMEVMSGDASNHEISEFKYILEAKFENSSGIRVQVDGGPPRQYTSQSGIIRIWKARENIKMHIDNGAAVSLKLNGHQLPRMGQPGETVDLNIPEDLQYQ